MNLLDIARYSNGQVFGGNATITGVTTDTRQLQAGALYVALRGERFDGHDFVAAARDAGAAAVLVEHAVDIDLPAVIVADSERALGQVAAAIREQRKATVVGITGSNGKTTVKSLVAAILSLHGRTHVNAGNYNNEIGLPLSVIALPKDAQYAVFEMGAGKPGDIEYLARIARPRIGLVNNIAAAHLERMGNLEGIAVTKGALISALPADGIAIVNADDAFADYFTGLAGARQVIRFGLSNGADVGATLVDGEPGVLQLVTPAGSTRVKLALPGLHNARNALAAAAVAVALDVPLDTIRQGLESASGVAGRLNLRCHASGAVVIDDSYNANPGSFAAAIATLAELPGRKILVMGDMKELGPDADVLHAQTGALASDAGIDELHAVGELSAHAVRAFDGSASLHASQRDLVDALRPLLVAGTSLLVKGSRSSAMERVVAALFDETEAAHAA